jgi:hypothetical protein
VVVSEGGKSPGLGHVNRYFGVLGIDRMRRRGSRGNPDHSRAQAAQDSSAHPDFRIEARLGEQVSEM